MADEFEDIILMGGALLACLAIVEDLSEELLNEQFISAEFLSEAAQSEEFLSRESEPQIPLGLKVSRPWAHHTEQVGMRY